MAKKAFSQVSKVEKVSSEFEQDPITGEMVYTGDEEVLGLEFIERQVRNLQGKVLTVIDATIPKGDQNKAVKDILKGHFSNTLSEFMRGAYPRIMEASEKQMHDLEKEHPEIKDMNKKNIK